MNRVAILTLLLLPSCAPSPLQQEMALTQSKSLSQQRSITSRQFDASDMSLMSSAVVGVLQDLGYTIDESQLNIGIIVGSRLSVGRVRAQITLTPMGQNRIGVRASFQRMIPRPGAAPPIGETIDDADVYRAFFEKLSQSLFLTAHEV